MGKTAKTKSKVKVRRIIESRTDFFYYTFRNILIVSIPLLVVCGVVLSHLSFHSSATGSSSGVDQIQFSLSSSCTMSSVVDEAHTKEINNGTYHSDVGKTTITTLCNDGNGYSVYANGYSNNEEGNNKLINAEHPEFSIDTGLATSGLISNWAMKLNNIPDDPSPTPAIIEPAYDNTYGLVPQYWTRVASRPSGTTDMDEGSSFTTTYAIYTTSNQHAGTYNGQVKYLLTHPAYPPAFLYMQDVDKWKNELALEESVQAIDARDGKKYWVTRLADGNVWMTQNLDFDISANITLNSNTTDLNVIYDNGQYQEYADGYAENNDIIYWTPTNSATTINFQNNGPITGWQNNNTLPYSASKTDGTETGHTSLGNYYSWTAAIASNNSSSLITQDTLNDVSNNPKNSICPKGWRLPTISSQSEGISGSTNEFARLNYLYNISTETDTNLLIEPVYFLRTGSIYDTSLHNINLVGYYWSSTQSNASAYYFRFDNSSVTRSNANRFSGITIRCIAR